MLIENMAKIGGKCLLFIKKIHISYEGNRIIALIIKD